VKRRLGVAEDLFSQSSASKLVKSGNSVPVSDANSSRRLATKASHVLAASLLMLVSGRCLALVSILRISATS